MGGESSSFGDILKRESKGVEDEERVQMSAQDGGSFHSYLSFCEKSVEAWWTVQCVSRQEPGGIELMRIRSSYR